ncbi:MAG: gamma-glutamyl-gamma-aminobutyrate hydrolase family protein [Candidatus Methanosuratincola sp.]
MVRVLVTTDVEEYKGAEPTDKLGKYLDQIRQAGGEPIVVVPKEEMDLYSLVKEAQAWLITGGKDIPPQEYQENCVHPETEEIDEHRLALEKEIYRQWKDTPKPILGVCYGMQFLNVMAGGDLIQHLPDELGHDRHKGCLPITVEASSKLSEILEAKLIQGRCSHHQAVRKVGEGYVPSAFSEGGKVIEAIEAVNERFRLGVQWHPERTPDDPATKRLFQAFIQSAKLIQP